MTSSASGLAARAREAAPLWSLKVPSAVRGIGLARESGTVLVRDDNHWLYLVHGSGSRQAQMRAPKELTGAAIADDGSTLVAGGKDGDLWRLAPDLMANWQRTVGKRVEAVAVSPLGDYVAAADGAGGVTLLTRKGRTVWKTESPRPLRFLAFVPETPFLLGSAEYGLVACFDAAGTMVWRDGLVAHVGSLAVSGDGSAVVLACYTDGLYRYGVRSGKPERQALADACRLAALSYDGQAILTAGLTSSVALLDRKGRSLGTHQLEAPASALALGALADRAIVGAADGKVQCFRWR
jgi:hypothetical protein